MKYGKNGITIVTRDMVYSFFLLTKRSRFDWYCKNINKYNNELRHFYTYFQGYAPGIVTFM